MTGDNGQRRRDEIVAWWALIARIVAFIFGMVLIGIDALVLGGQSDTVRLGFLAAGVAFTGYAVPFSEILRSQRE